MRNKKILITGGNSNIGSDLVKFFLKENLVISTFNKKRLRKPQQNNSQIVPN